MFASRIAALTYVNTQMLLNANVINPPNAFLSLLAYIYVRRS